VKKVHSFFFRSVIIAFVVKELRNYFLCIYSRYHTYLPIYYYLKFSMIIVIIISFNCFHFSIWNVYTYTKRERIYTLQLTYYYGGIPSCSWNWCYWKKKFESIFEVIYIYIIVIYSTHSYNSSTYSLYNISEYNVTYSVHVFRVINCSY